MIHGHVYAGADLTKPVYHISRIWHKSSRILLIIWSKEPRFIIYKSIRSSTDRQKASKFEAFYLPFVLLAQYIGILFEPKPVLRPLFDSRIHQQGACI